MTRLLIWSLSKKGLYSCAATWDYIRFKCQEVSWWRTLWFPLAIPKHAFILWLAARDRLLTGENLAKRGYTGYSVCVFVGVVLTGGTISSFYAALVAGCRGRF
jgi:hypothetical protein